MRTYPHVRDDGTIAYFEISNGFPWSLGFMRRVLTSVEGVSAFRRERNSDDRFSFLYFDRRCVVHEPFGDNSRYWIGPAEPEPPIDMTAMRDAFTQFRVGLTFDREFNGSTSKTTTAAALQAALPQAMDALATLHSMSYAELKQLPAHNTIELAGHGRRVTLTTYMDLLKSHESDLQIAVQMLAHGRLGFCRVWARGFRVTTKGTYRDLEEKELYEYT